MQRSQLVDWNYEQSCKQAVEAINRNGFNASYYSTKVDAIDYIIREAKDARTIGFGGSVTVDCLAIAEKLGSMSKELLIHDREGLSLDERLSIMRRQLTCDLFLTSTNALTLDGCLVNIDATGNRVGSMIFGPGKVIVVSGRNKLVSDQNEAIIRIKRNAAPTNAKRLQYNTPCAKTGFCNDCMDSLNSTDTKMAPNAQRNRDHKNGPFLFALNKLGANIFCRLK